MNGWVLALALMAGLAGCATPMPTTDPVLLAQQRWQQGRNSEAIRLLLAYVRRHPTQQDARYNLALFLAQQGQTERAIRLYRDNLAIGPHLASQVNLALLLAQRHENDAALAVLQAARRAFPHRALPAYLIGQLQWRQGRNSAAEQAFRQALAAEPDNALAHLHYARFLAATHRLRDALNQARQAVHLAPDCAACWRIDAQLLRKHGQVQQAIAAYQRSLAIQPDIHTRKQLIALLEQTGDHARAARMRAALQAWLKQREGHADE